MKKIFTFLTMLCFLGFLGAQAQTTVNLTFALSESLSGSYMEPYQYVKVYKDAETQENVELTSNTVALDIPSGQQVTYIIQPLDFDNTITIPQDALNGKGQLNRNYPVPGSYQLMFYPIPGTVDITVTVLPASEYEEPVKDPVNPIYFDFTLPENTDDPFIVSSISFLDRVTAVTNAEELEQAWISFYNEEREDGSAAPTVTNATLTINFATNEEGEPIYEIGAVSMSYTTKSNSNPVAFPTDRIVFNNTEATITFDYVAGMDKIYVVVKDAETGWDITFNVNDPAGVVVTYNNETVELDGESTIITVDPNSSFTFKAAEGWKVDEAVYGNGKSISYTGTTDDPTFVADELADGTVVNVTVSEVIPEDQYEDSFTVWFEEGEDGEVLFASASYQGGESGALKEFTELAGSQTVMFDAASKTTYQVKATPINTTEYPNIYAYYCGVYRGETPTQYTSTVYSGVPVNGAELALYVNEPTAYQVVFAGENGATETETNVWTNEVNQLTGWSNATEPWEMLEGTVLTIYVPETYSVSLNEEVIQPIEEEVENAKEGVAVYEVVVNEYTYIVFSGDNGEYEGPSGPSTGVAGIDAENGPAVIYNLQGIRVNSENVPAGIYLINGKKVAISK